LCRMYRGIFPAAPVESAPMVPAQSEIWNITWVHLHLLNKHFVASLSVNNITHAIWIVHCLYFWLVQHSLFCLAIISTS